MEDLARRQLLRFLAASPLLGLTTAGRLFAEESLDAIQLPAHLIKSPTDALDVFDFHNVAKQVLPTSHYGYLAIGTDGNETLSANREAFHADGELASARAAKTRGHLQILSNVSSTSIEDVIDARGEPVWFQLYPTNKWSTAKKMLLRAQDAGAKVVVLTVDLNSDSNRVLLGQFSRADDRDCSACHGAGPDDWFATKPMYSGTSSVTADWDMSGMTWGYLDRLREATSMKIVIKGIVTAEDAANCVQYGADADYVSNHGGRAEASGWGSLDSLAEVVAAVDGRVPVIVDSGFRRGTDIFKALATGASAVSIGRAYIWGLAAFGQPGVEKVLEMLNAEPSMVVGQLGARTVADIGPQHIGHQNLLINK